MIGTKTTMHLKTNPLRASRRGNHLRKAIVESSDLSEPRYAPERSWLEHGPFELWLVANMRPQSIVELGTLQGFSYFCFCQAVEENKLSSKCFAVGAWRGDDHAEFKGVDIFRDANFANKPYAHFSTLLRVSINEALTRFEDGSVDLLSIHGSQLEKDVKGTFDEWLPKLSRRAVVLFHDFEVLVRDSGFRPFWAELSGRWPAFSFANCGGLGVLFVGSDQPPILHEMSLAGSNADLTLQWRSAFALPGQLFGHKAQVRRLKQENSDLTARANWLAQKLKAARRDPLSQAFRLSTFWLSTAAAKVGAIIPGTSFEGFRRIAKYYDPARIDPIATKKIGRSPDSDATCQKNYRKLMHFWRWEQRLAGSKLNRVARLLETDNRLSILLPMVGLQPENLERTIRSVKAQRFKNWELVLLGDASLSDAARSAIESQIAADRRIQATFLDGEHSKAALYGAGLQRASGERFLPLEAGDILGSDALLHLLEASKGPKSPAIVYADQDCIDGRGNRHDPHFKPDWNRDLFYAWNYVDGPVLIDTNLARKAGGYRESMGSAAGYDLLLRCVAECSDTDIRHVPRVLLHRPKERAIDQKVVSEAWDSGLLALSQHLAMREGRNIPVSKGPVPGSYLAQWPLPEKPPLVSLIIPTRDRLDLLKVAVDSILLRTDYPNYEILIVDNGSVEGETLAWFDAITKQEQRVRVLRDDRPFNYSALNNAAVTRAKGEIIGLVNNDIEVISRGWLREMVSLALRPRTGCVGAKLYYPDGRIQHGGVIIGIGKDAGHSHKYFPGDSPGYFKRLLFRQDISAVTGACLVVRKDIYESVNGLNEENLGIAFNDIDFCLKVLEAGFRNVWTPLAELIHHESPSRGIDDTAEKRKRLTAESEYLRTRWRTASWPDPSYNPNLSLQSEDFCVRNIRLVGRRG